MKKFLFRMFAYGIDYGIVTIIFLLLAFIPFINPFHTKLEKANSDFDKEYKLYEEVRSNVSKTLADKEIEEEEITFDIPQEYDEIVLETKEYTEEEIVSLMNQIYTIYQDRNIENAVLQQRYSTPIDILSVIILLLYFGLVPYKMMGQTLGKKIFKLRVYNVDDKKKKISLRNYMLRAFLVTGSIFILLNAILCNLMDINTYSYTYNIMYAIRTIYFGMFAIVYVFTNDNRSIHDYILKTNVELTNNL